MLRLFRRRRTLANRIRQARVRGQGGQIAAGAEGENFPARAF
jgi:hypothetical protein